MDFTNWVLPIYAYSINTQLCKNAYELSSLTTTSWWVMFANTRKHPHCPTSRKNKPSTKTKKMTTLNTIPQDRSYCPSKHTKFSWQTPTELYNLHSDMNICYPRWCECGCLLLFKIVTNPTPTPTPSEIANIRVRM